MNSGSSAFIFSGAQSAFTCSISWWTQKSRPSVHWSVLRRSAQSSCNSVIPWLRSKTRTFFTLLHCFVFNAWSSLFFNGEPFPPRTPKSLVITTVESQSAIRSATLFALKPPKTTEWTAPIRAQASKATHVSTTIGMYTVTRSPFFTPCFFNTLANFFTWRSSSA